MRKRAKTETESCARERERAKIERAKTDPESCDRQLPKRKRVVPERESCVT